MSFRLEKKLFIKKENFFEFKKYLFKNNLKQLYRPRKINSLYFDNYYLGMYHDSIEGITPRKKIRIRNYPFSSPNNFFVENKISSVEGRYKTNHEISNEDYDNYIKKGFFDSKYGICKPALNIDYDREYLVIDNIRITLDTNIKYSLYGKPQQLKDPNIIVELKTSINQDIDKLFMKFPFQETRFSKYCNGIDMWNLD